MPRLVRHTLFWKYAAYYAGLVGALLVLSSGMGGYFAFRQASTALEELQRARAGFAASEIDGFVARIVDAMESTIGKFDGVIAGDEEDVRLELIALLKHQPSIAELRIIDRAGHERLVLSRVLRNVTNKDRDWSSEELFKRARTGATYFGPVQFREGSEPYLSMAVSRKPAGPVLIAEVNLQFVVDVISKSSLGTRGLAYIVDSRGRLISHPNNNLVLGNNDFSILPQVRRGLGWRSPGAPAADGARNFEGVEVIATAVPIERLAWLVFIEQPYEEAFRPVYASIGRSIALVLIGLVAALAASLVLARHMVRPIRQIESGAREIGEGRLDHRIDVKTGDELEALGHQFNQMTEKLQDIVLTQEQRIAERTHDLALANDAKTRFLAAASHDLRQPMHALSLFVGQLSVVPMRAAGRVLVERIQRSVVALEALLEALLDLSKLDVGAVRPQLRTFPIHDLLSRLVTDFVPAAEAKGLELRLAPTSLWVRSDPLLLERIVLNLVANAIRYTAEGRVLIGCRRHGESVDLIVVDSGIGIAALHLPNIFQEFFRVGPRAGGLAPGLGLGLAIVKRLALLLDHPMAVQSQPGRGSLFRVRIPRASPQFTSGASPADLGQDLRGTCVLVVDDQSAAREALAGLLVQWGCVVVSADGGDEALRQAANRSPDLVLCDLNLAAGENGLTVIDRLRAMIGPALACVLVTGEFAPEVIAAARASGVPMAIKPIQPGKLRALIEHIIHAHRSGALSHPE